MHIDGRRSLRDQNYMGSVRSSWAITTCDDGLTRGCLYNRLSQHSHCVQKAYRKLLCWEAENPFLVSLRLRIKYGRIYLTPYVTLAYVLRQPMNFNCLANTVRSWLFPSSYSFRAIDAGVRLLDVHLLTVKAICQLANGSSAT